MIKIKWNNIYIKNGTYESKVFRIKNNLKGKLIKGLYVSVGDYAELYIRTSSDGINWSTYRRLLGSTLEEESNSDYFYYQVAALLFDRYNNPLYLKRIELYIEEALVYDTDTDLSIPIKLNLYDKLGNQEIKIYNNSTNEEMVVDGLNKSEILYIDSENETIVSSHESLGIYRYDNHNDVYLHLASGKNFITTKGEFELDIKYQEIYLHD